MFIGIMHTNTHKQKKKRKEKKKTQPTVKGTHWKHCLWTLNNVHCNARHIHTYTDSGTLFSQSFWLLYNLPLVSLLSCLLFLLRTTCGKIMTPLTEIILTQRRCEKRKRRMKMCFIAEEGLLRGPQGEGSRGRKGLRGSSNCN